MKGFEAVNWQNPDAGGQAATHRPFHGGIGSTIEARSPYQLPAEPVNRAMDEPDRLVGRNSPPAPGSGGR